MESLSKSKQSLARHEVQDVTHLVTRRSSKLMAIVFDENCNNVDVRFKPCATGLSGRLALSIIVSWCKTGHVFESSLYGRNLLEVVQENLLKAFIVNQPESQRRFRLDQRFFMKMKALS